MIRRRHAVKARELFLVSIMFAALLQVAALDRSGAAQPMNARCANSMFVTDDIIRYEKRSIVVHRIGKVIDSRRRVVGWTILGNDGSRYAQANRAMSQPDQRLAGLQLHAKDRLSGIIELPRIPWHDLRLETCSGSEMRAAKYVPWRPQDLPI